MKPSQILFIVIWLSLMLGGPTIIIGGVALICALLEGDTRL